MGLFQYLAVHTYKNLSGLKSAPFFSVDTYVLKVFSSFSFSLLKMTGFVQDVFPGGSDSLFSSKKKVMLKITASFRVYGKQYPRWHLELIQDNQQSRALAKIAMFCIWWDQKGKLYYELLKPGETVNGDRYKRHWSIWDNPSGAKTTTVSQETRKSHTGLVHNKKTWLENSCASGVLTRLGPT